MIGDDLSERVKQQAERLAQEEKRLKEAGLSDEEIKRATDPARCLHAQLSEELWARRRALVRREKLR
jgi:hypothetical protein